MGCGWEIALSALQRNKWSRDLATNWLLTQEGKKFVAQQQKAAGKGSQVFSSVWQFFGTSNYPQDSKLPCLAEMGESNFIVRLVNFVEETMLQSGAVFCESDLFATRELARRRDMRNRKSFCDLA